MAEVVDKMPEFTPRGRVGQRKYGFLMDGRAWRISHGVDFHGGARAVEANIRKTAKEMGCKATVLRRGTDIFVQAKPVQL